MLDSRLRRLIDPPLDSIGVALGRRGIGADAVTLAGFAVGSPSWPALAMQAYTVALALILLNRVMDGLDGAVARHAGPTDFGGYLDIVCDFLFYSGVVFFFAAGPAGTALPAAFLIFSFVGTGSSFLAYAIFAAKRGITTDIRGGKVPLLYRRPDRRHRDHRAVRRPLPVPRRLPVARLGLRGAVLDHHRQPESRRLPAPSGSDISPERN